MFNFLMYIFALTVYLFIPSFLFYYFCYYIAYLISCIPDIWSYIKAWWKVRLGS